MPPVKCQPYALCVSPTCARREMQEPTPIWHGWRSKTLNFLPQMTLLGQSATKCIPLIIMERELILKHSLVKGCTTLQCIR